MNSTCGMQTSNQIDECMFFVFDDSLCVLFVTGVFDDENSTTVNFKDVNSNITPLTYTIFDCFIHGTVHGR